jgi:hypothetical protein
MHQTWNNIMIYLDMKYIYDLFSTYIMCTMMHQTWTSLENYQTMIILCLHYNQIKI